MKICYQFKDVTITTRTVTKPNLRRMTQKADITHR